MPCSGCPAVHTVFKGIKNVARGYAYLALGVNQELGKKRFAICSNCPHIRGGLTCNLCGCDMAAKSRLPEVECADPKNKRWLAEPIAA